MNSSSRYFIKSVFWVLLATGAAKLFSATGGAKLLDMPESLLPLTFRQTLWLVGSIELAVALFLVLGRSERLKLVWITWLSGNFALYRIAILLMGVGKRCPFLGSLTQKLYISQAVAEHVLMGLVIYMLFGSLFFLIALRGQGRDVPVVPGNTADGMKPGPAPVNA